MVDHFWLLCLLALHFCISFTHLEPLTEQPLIFNPYTLEIYPDLESMTENAGPYAVACPAKRPDEVQFDKKDSLDHKSLFVRECSQRKTDVIRGIVCDDYVKLAVVLHTDNVSKEKLVEFGYEVYINPTHFAQRFKRSNFKRFSPLSPSPSVLKQALNIITGSGANDSPPTLKQDRYMYGIDISSTEQQMDFVWLPKFIMKYNFSNWNVESLTYFITHDAINSLQKQCWDDKLGEQFYKNKQPNKYYSPENQKKIFKEVILPVNTMKDGTVCKSKQYCVKQYNLLLPDQFRSRSSSLRRISCSQLTTIPLWYDTVEYIMNYLEKFLAVVAEVTNRELKIITGTHETLTFPKKESDKFQEMYLHKKMIPIPKIIYNIVRYKSHECDAQVAFCWFDVLIVIHNQPEVLPDDKLCDDVCKQLGWESIQFMSTTNGNVGENSKFIYCCRLDEDMRTKLGYKTDTLNKLDLHLNYFPYNYNKSQGVIEFENLQEKIERRMNELLGKNLQQKLN